MSRKCPARSSASGLLLAVALTGAALVLPPRTFAAGADGVGEVVQVVDAHTVVARLPWPAKVGDKIEIYDTAADGYKLVVAHAEVQQVGSGNAGARLHIIYLEASYAPKNLMGTKAAPDSAPA